MTTPLRGITGKVINLSPTAYTTYQACPMKWFFIKVIGLIDPPTKAMQTGIDVHDHAEHWSKGGGEPEKPDTAWRIFEPLIPHLPAPGTYTVESWAKGAVPSPDGAVSMPFVGKIDLWRWPAVSPELPALDDWGPGHLHIHDHKTSSDPMRWGKTSEELALDPQMLGYAAVLARGFKTKPTRIDVSHGYMATRGMPYAHMVRAYNVPWDNVEEVWAGYQRAAGEQHALITGYHAGGVTEADVQRNSGACGMYGGCPFRARCDKIKASRVDITRALENPNASMEAQPEEDTMATLSPAQRREILRRNCLSGNPNPPDAAPDQAPAAPPAAPPTAFEGVQKAAAAIKAHVEKKGLKRLARSAVQSVAKRAGVPKHEEDVAKWAGFTALEGDVWVMTAEPKPDPQGAVAALKKATGHGQLSVDLGQTIMDQHHIPIADREDVARAAGLVRIDRNNVFHTTEEEPEPPEEIALGDDCDGTEKPPAEEEIALGDDCDGTEKPLPEDEGEAALVGCLLTQGLRQPTDKDVKEANKATGTFSRLHKKRIAAVLAWFEGPAPAPSTTPPSPPAAPPSASEGDDTPGPKNPKGGATTRALQAKGFSQGEIDAMTADQVEAALKPEPELEPPVMTPPVLVPVVCSPNKAESLALTLYVNCYRSDGLGESLDVVMAPITDTIAKQQGVAHFDLLDYGKGRKMAAGELAKALAEKGAPALFPSGIVLVSTRSLHFDHCFPLLEAITGTVLVRGSRG